ncbi:MAG: rhodanese-like domain-containing protein [Salinivirgaceae bacterium]
MKKFNLLLFGFLFAILFVNTSCDKEETTKVNEAELLATYLETTDYVNTYMPSIISATDVNSGNLVGSVYIIDIRAAADFANGHIANAVNVTFGDLLNHMQTTDLSNYEKVAIVCYSGQTAAYGASLLRLAGYDKVFSMAFGMSSWNSAFAGSWNNNIGNSKGALFVTDESPKAAAGELPELTTGKNTGEEILATRIATLFTEGFDPAKISNAAVFDALESNYIVNYWPANHYALGHIPGAIQYTPKESMKLAADLKTLPTDKTVVVYCYTGQTSAYLTAYLRVLGYDAKSLLFGTNGMWYDNMVENQMTVFNESKIMEYDYVQ